MKFNQFVGVLQIGNLTIEILPKPDKLQPDENRWKALLIGMLQAVGIFNIHTPSSSDLQLKNNSILDLYIQLFIQEVSYLIRRGLIKKYRKKEGNAYSLKGGIQFAQHLQQNLVHQERFYIRYTTYNQQHLFHQILYKTLLLIKRINTNNLIQSQLATLLLDFPEQADLKVSEALFNRLSYNRKSTPYKKAIDIARLLLMNYHPNIYKGRNHVLALLFNMNDLWEQFVYVSLQKHFRLNGNRYFVKRQVSKKFWKPESGYTSSMKPDIVIYNQEECFVLDTKWKNLNGYKPSSDDLRQMFAYLKYFGSKRVGLVYPGTSSNLVQGNYYETDSVGSLLGDEVCSIISVDANELFSKNWQFTIYKQIMGWMGNSLEKNKT